MNPESRLRANQTQILMQQTGSKASLPLLLIPTMNTKLYEELCDALN